MTQGRTGPNEGETTVDPRFLRVPCGAESYRDSSDQPSTLGIVGAGMMGTAIAAAAIPSGIGVALADADADTLAAAPQRIQQQLLARQPGCDAAGLVARQVRVTADAADLADCDLVLESIVENLAAKQRLYAAIEPRMAPHALLASNTSTIPIQRLADGLQRPERFCGIHFFHPVAERRLVEIIRGPRTAAETIAKAAALARQIGKLPLVVCDGPGFLVNRLLVPYLNEAMQLVLEGAAIEAVDAVARDFGMAMGPLELLDEIGLETALRGGVVLVGAYPDRVIAPPLPVALIKAKRLGCKSGAGFYAYSPGPDGHQARQSDPAVLPLVARWAQPGPAPREDMFLHRLLLPMLLEATRILDERLIASPADVELGVVFGLGFPACRGGLLSWADSLGPARILELLQPLTSLGPRYQPTPGLLRCVERGGRFLELTIDW